MSGLFVQCLRSVLSTDFFHELDTASGKSIPLDAWTIIFSYQFQSAGDPYPSDILMEREGDEKRYFSIVNGQFLWQKTVDVNVYAVFMKNELTRCCLDTVVSQSDDNWSIGFSRSYAVIPNSPELPSYLKPLPYSDAPAPLTGDVCQINYPVADSTQIVSFGRIDTSRHHDTAMYDARIEFGKDFIRLKNYPLFGIHVIIEVRPNFWQLSWCRGWGAPLRVMASDAQGCSLQALDPYFDFILDSLKKAGYRGIVLWPKLIPIEM